MPDVAHLCRRLGNGLYSVAFPVYRPLYSIFKAYSDRAERRLIAEQLQAGAIAVDGGANIGVFSRFLSRCVGPGGAVHSFEPSPDNFKRLRQTVSGCDNVRLNQMAISNETGESVLYLSDQLNVDHRAYPSEGEARRTISIRSTKLDDYFQPGERVDFVKIDIQGFELHALLGAERVLGENPQVKLLLEFWPHGLREAGMSGEALISFLSKRDFILFHPGETGYLGQDRSPSSTWGPKSYLNLFAQRAAPSGSLRLPPFSLPS